MATSIISIIMVIFCSIVGATGSFFFKQASEKLSFKFISLITNFKLFLGFFFFGISALVYLIALRNGDLTVLYPISSLSYVWTLFIGKKLLNEKINFYKQAGIVLILAGVIIIVS